MFLGAKGGREGMNPRLPHRNPFYYRQLRIASFVCVSFLLPSTQAQEPAPVPTPPPATKEPAANSQQPAKPKPDNASEISQSETPATFKVRVNLVQVRVIVRDPSGKTIDNLTRQDFVLYDQGKPQFITNFS